MISGIMNTSTRRKESEIIQILFSNRKIDELSDYLTEHPDLDLIQLIDNQANTVLHQLCFEGHLDIMKLFVKEARKRLKKNHKKQLYQKGEQQQIMTWMNQQNSQGFTALLYASYSGHLDIIRYLIQQYNVNDQLTTKTGLNPLHLASQKNMILPLLYFKNRININLGDHLKSTPLHWAAYMNSEQIISFLLTEDSLTCLDERDNDGNTPLMLAVAYGNTRVVRRLLIKGANRYLTNHAGKTPLEVAHDSQFKTISKMLNEDYSCFDLFKFYCNVKLQYRPKHRTYTIPIVYIIAFVLNTAIINILFTFKQWKPIALQAFIVGAQLLLYLSLLRGPEQPEMKDYDQLIKDKNEKQVKKLCFDCKNFHPKRGYHCDICRVCIPQYDHHCTWINNCVGKRNIARFMFFLIFLIFSLGIFGTLSVFAEICLIQDDLNIQNQWFEFRYRNETLAQRICLIAVTGVILITSLFIFPVLMLFLVQIKNLLKNKTTYEMIRSPTEQSGQIKEKMRKYNNNNMSLHNCNVMCSDNPSLTTSLTDTYDQPLAINNEFSFDHKQ